MAPRFLYRRREFITLLGGAAGWPLAASAQQSVRELPRVGAIFNSRSENNEAFRHGLIEAGYVDGRNVVLEERLIVLRRTGLPRSPVNLSSSSPRSFSPVPRTQFARQ